MNNRARQTLLVLYGLFSLVPVMVGVWAPFPTLARAAPASVAARTGSSFAAWQNAPAAPSSGIVLVTNTNDNGPGSLRAVIAAALPGDTVIFSLTLPATIILTGGGIGISSDLTVSGPGPGPDQLSISGNNAHTIFVVSAGAVTLNNLTLRDASSTSTYGGAVIVNGGALTLTNSSVISNTAVNGGGGIATFGTSLLINNSVFLSNTAPSGGAILQLTGTVNIVSSTLSGNIGVQGGAINVGSTQSILNITDSTLANNHVHVSGSPGRGGAIESFGSITVASSRLISNSADTAAGAIDISAGWAAISGTAISGNYAGNGAGGIDDYGVLTVTNSTISLNTTSALTTSRGGGLTVQGITTATLTNSTLSGNSANDDAGGIYVDGSTVNLVNVTIANNIADLDNDGSGRGGGISNPDAGRIIALNTIIAGNFTRGGTAPDCYGTLKSLDFNLIEDTTGCSITGTVTDDVYGQNPDLAPLAVFGGATATQAPHLGSPVLDRIPPGTNGCGTTILTDQRGKPRPQNGSCDIGAFEGALNFLALPLFQR